MLNFVGQIKFEPNWLVVNFLRQIYSSKQSYSNHAAAQKLIISHKLLSSSLLLASTIEIYLTNICKECVWV